jgi:protein-disulfide isomerase
VPSSRRSGRPATGPAPKPKPSPATKPASPAPSPSASPWSSGGLPLLPLTIVAAIAGVVLIVLLVVVNGGGQAPGVAQASNSPGTSASDAASAPASAAAPASGSPGGSPVPAVSGPPIETPARTTPPDLAFGRSIGSPDAPVQMDVWADFQCPACDAFTGSVEPYLIDTYIRPGLARLTFHDIATIGEESLGAAISARCADRQGKFWQYHDLLFANQAAENSGVFTRARSQQFAQALGLDLVAFTACLDDQEVANAVQQETTQGLGSGIKETPTLFVNGNIVQPATSSSAISSAMDAVLKSGSPSPSASPAP